MNDLCAPYVSYALLTSPLTPAKNNIGMLGERAVEMLFMSHGYTLIGSNVYFKGGEADRIFVNSGKMYIVEVRSSIVHRGESSFVDRLDRRKKHRLLRTLLLADAFGYRSEECLILAAFCNILYNKNNAEIHTYIYQPFISERWKFS